MQKNNDKDYYSTGEMAEIIKVSPSTVFRWCETSRIKAYKVGSRWRVKKSIFDQYLKDCGIEK